MNKISDYKLKLIVMGLLMQDENEYIEKIGQNKSLQEFYISENTISFLKKIIEDNNETSLIDLEMKDKINKYLSFFRDLNNSLKKVNRKQINELINNCIKTNNMIYSKTDSKVFYANELYIRSYGWKSLDGCYKLVQDSIYIEIIKKSIIQDVYYFNKFLNSNLDSTDEDLKDEFTIWSINKLIDEYPELLKNSNFLNNCYSLVKAIKHKYSIYYLKNFASCRRIQKENKELQKKIR